MPVIPKNKVESIIVDDSLKPFYIRVASGRVAVIKIVTRYKRKPGPGSKVDRSNSYKDEKLQFYVKDVEEAIDRIIKEKLVNKKREFNLVEYLNFLRIENKKVLDAINRKKRGKEQDVPGSE